MPYEGFVFDAFSCTLPTLLDKCDFFFATRESVTTVIHTLWKDVTFSFKKPMPYEGFCFDAFSFTLPTLLDECDVCFATRGSGTTVIHTPGKWY